MWSVDKTARHVSVQLRALLLRAIAVSLISVCAKSILLPDFIIFGGISVIVVVFYSCC